MQNPPAPIDPANAAVRELEPTIAAFMARNPCSVIAERGVNPQGAYRPLVGVFTPTRDSIDSPVPELVLDAFIQLRAALDNELASKVRQSGNDPKGVRFPVADDLETLEKDLASVAVDRSGLAIQNYLRAKQPYAGGSGALLWATCRLAINLQRIHESGAPILAYAITIDELINARTGQRAGGGEALHRSCLGRSEIIPELPEELFEDGDRIEAKIVITILEGQPLSGLPVLQAVRDCATAVRRTLDDLREVP